MRLSNYFCPILKEKPKDAFVVSHALMLRAGIIRQTSSGIYSFLPMGKLILDNITKIVKEEMDKAGAIEMLMPIVQTADIWKESGRFDDYGQEMLKIKDRQNRDMVYGPTNEEQITQIVRENIKSYKELPLNLYHVQWKFRDEIRPRFGLMRGREFLMKDSYSFDLSEEEGRYSYYKMFSSYLAIFKRLGFLAVPMEADSGPIGGNLSHEFIILAKTGETDVFYDRRILEIEKLESTDYSKEQTKETFEKYTSFYSKTDEKHDENTDDYIASKDHIETHKGIEVGHVFWFGDKYSKKMNAKYLDKSGSLKEVQMGSYGIGITRLMAAFIEVNHDDRGIIWSKALAPFCIIINALGNSENVTSAALEVYEGLKAKGYKVLYNDLDESAGSKLATSDLLGIPVAVNIGNKSIANSSLEVKLRKSGKVINVALEESINKIIEIYNNED